MRKHILPAGVLCLLAISLALNLAQAMTHGAGQGARSGQGMEADRTAFTANELISLKMPWSRLHLHYQTPAYAWNHLDDCSTSNAFDYCLLKPRPGSCKGLGILVRDDLGERVITEYDLKALQEIRVFGSLLGDGLRSEEVARTPAADQR